MYQYLTASIKRRVMEDLKRHFSYIVEHKDIVKNIRYKYDFKERPQKGIVLMNVSATPIKMASDNYLAALESYIIKVNVGNFSGQFLDWIREDTLALDRNKGYFPTSPGLYYLRMEVLNDPEKTARVYLEPLLQVYQEPLITFITGNETSASLTNFPIHGASARLYLNGDVQIFRGPAFTLQGTQSLHIYDPLFGLPEGPVSVSSLSNMGPFNIITGVNDVLSFSVNGTLVVVILLPGLVSAQAAKVAVDLAANAAGLFAPEYRSVVEGDRLHIIASRSLEWDPYVVSTASPQFGYPQGLEAPIARGLLYRPVVLEHQSTMTLYADGVEYSVVFEPGLYKDPLEILGRLQDQLSGTPVTPILGESGDYSINAMTGEVTFLQPFLPGDQIIADYMYPTSPSGPYVVEKNQSNNQIIPGVVLSFGESFEDGDKICVGVYDKRDHVADLYGGKSDVSMDFEILARDPMDRESIVDYLLMYFHQHENERFGDDGLCITSVSGGGESEDIYDETEDSYYYRSSVSVSFQTDWEFYVPRPLYIERISPLSYEQEARVASRLPIDASQDDYVKPVVSLSTRELYEQAKTGLAKKYERIT
jgi:hypothetical protein